MLQNGVLTFFEQGLISVYHRQRRSARAGTRRKCPILSGQPDSGPARGGPAALPALPGPGGSALQEAERLVPGRGRHAGAVHRRHGNSVKDGGRLYAFRRLRQKGIFTRTSSSSGARSISPCSSIHWMFSSQHSSDWERNGASAVSIMGSSVSMLDRSTASDSGKFS